MPAHFSVHRARNRLQHSALTNTSRTVQASALEAWSKDPTSGSQTRIAQQLFYEIAAVNALATSGNYTGPHPSQSTRDLKEGFRGWS